MKSLNVIFVINQKDLPGKRLDGVNVVVVTDERSEAVGVTIVEHDEVIDGYLVLIEFEKELHN
jgi:hypothetical protein